MSFHQIDRISNQCYPPGSKFFWIIALKHYKTKLTSQHERKRNEQQLSSQASPDGERSEHEARNKMEALAFDSIHCCLPRLYRCLETLN